MVLQSDCFAAYAFFLSVGYPVFGGRCEIKNRVSRCVVLPGTTLVTGLAGK
ncbi:hypothetical protein RMSM_00391 [Rhodopirellula maiorica SM1]|uniref:Uncharacterized protein n=1 Tax=Rhodopirellula maiorica SM1 TaxID=1265738 RepID=M5RTK8_9BACT|nr:hypothetical protein RMSM_00391 [Rhodopirellula maiorica SM1]